MIVGANDIYERFPFTCYAQFYLIPNFFFTISTLFVSDVSTGVIHTPEYIHVHQLYDKNCDPSGNWSAWGALPQGNYDIIYLCYIMVE